jgi:hypothetical protein
MGKCTLVEPDTCVVASNADCARSRACSNFGQCVFSRLLSECEVPARAAIHDRLPNLKTTTSIVELNDRMIRTRVIEMVGELLQTIAPGTFAFGAHTLPNMPPKPGLEVTVDRAFEIGKWEVTQELYELVMGRNPSEVRGSKLPVLGVRFYDAVHFLNRLSEVFDLRPAYFRDEARSAWIWDITANGFRLPTELEWEFAARANEEFFYSGSNDADAVGACGRVQPVASKKPNAWGLYDFSCNAAELTWNVKPGGIDPYSLYHRSQLQYIIETSQTVIAKGRFLGQCTNCGSGAVYDVQFLPQGKGLSKKRAFLGIRFARSVPISDKEKRAGKLLPEDARCRENIECGESGKCGSIDSECVASHDWMCRQSQACRVKGLCTNSNKRCVATDLEDCRKSRGCDRACLCELEDTKRICVARSESCCENRAECKDEGLCRVDKSTGRCVAKVDADCRASAACSRHGRCKAKTNACVVTDESCRAQPSCITDGLCFEVGGSCQAKDCRVSYSDVCGFYGRCTLHVGKCVTVTDAQCKKADVCLLYGKCERGKDGQCRIPKAGLPDSVVTPSRFCAHALRVFVDEYERKREVTPAKYERSRFRRECTVQVKARLNRKNRNLFISVGRCVMDAQTQNGLDACVRKTPFGW